VLKSVVKDGVETGPAINYGKFINVCVEFTIVVFCAFVVVKLMNKVIALRIADVRAAVDGIQSAADLKKAAAKIDELKKMVD
jgi:large-conductance mechanosensitive channel